MEVNCAPSSGSQFTANHGDFSNEGCTSQIGGGLFCFEVRGVTPEWVLEMKQVRVNGKDLTEAIKACVVYAPTRELNAALGLQVEWDRITKTVKFSN
jgi:hypothetical protein